MLGFVMKVKMRNILKYWFFFFCSLQSLATVFLDTNFGTSGIAFIAQGTGAYVTKITTQSDGKILVIGMCVVAGTSTVFLARLTTTGALDTTFNSTGIATLNYGTDIFVQSFAMQSDGKILIAGYSVSDGVAHLLIARYSSTGSLDDTFGSGGIVTKLIGSSTAVGDLAQQTISEENYILVTGQAIINQVPCAYVARYDEDGVLDETFGSDGVVITQVGIAATPTSIIVQSDNKVIVAGSVFDGVRKVLLARYTIGGVLDTDFGTQGIVTTSVADSVDDGADDVVVQADGKIVLVGRSQIDGHGKILIARYTSLGVLDDTFGDEGTTTTGLDADVFGSSVSIKSNGTFMVSGAVGDFGYEARYLADGFLDISFGANGFITTTLTSTVPLFPTCLDASERILMGGALGDNGVVARYRSTNDDFITITSPADGSTITSSTFAMTGRSSQENKTVRVKIGSTVLGTATTDSNGNWNAGTSPVVGNGAKTIMVELLDGQTVLASATSGITLTAATDSITMTPASGETVISSTPTLSGTSSRGSQSVKITINGTVAATVTTDALGAWTYTVSSALKNGSHDIQAQLLVDSAVAASVTNTIVIASYSWIAQPECKNYRVISGSFTTADNPPIILSGSGTACPPTCNFSVSRLSSSRFQINFLPSFLFTPMLVVSLMKTSSSSGSVNAQSAVTTTSAVINKTGSADQVYFMATSCLG